MPSYIYSFKYDYHHDELCKLESRQLFNQEEKDNLLFSNIGINPSQTSFVKNRLEIMLSAPNYDCLLNKIQAEKIRINDFKAEYLLLYGDPTENTERRKKLIDVGYRIQGEPNFDSPSIIYSICYYANTWYFGTLTKQNTNWHKHKQKPHSFSSSIGMKTARALVSIASKGNKKNKLLDACCGVGTIMLEACFSGYRIEGCDINWKSCQHTKNNLEHYTYEARVHCSDIKEIVDKYDACIVDLPYNLSSYSDDLITANIINSASRLSSRIVIVSIADIEEFIQNSGLKTIESCKVEKRGRSSFTRIIWVCERA